MKKHLRTPFVSAEIISIILLSLYTMFVLFSHTILSIVSKAALARAFLLCCLSAVVLSVLIVKSSSVFKSIIREIEDRQNHNRLSMRSKAKNVAIVSDLVLFAAILSVFIVYYIAYYPGAASPDTINQYEQAINNAYNDWHPVIHTLIVFKLPLLLTKNWFGSVVLLQIISFSVVLSYASRVIDEYTGKKYALLFLLFVLLNPQTAALSMFPWKDTTFAIITLLLMIYALRIFITKGKWLESIINAALFIIVLSVTTLIRHNAILFTGPLLLAVALCSVDKKRVLLICLSAVVLISGIKYPIYSALNVEQPGSRQIETLGLPMTVIGAAVRYEPEHLDEDTLDFAYKVAPKEVWEARYASGRYNGVKWNELTNNDVIEEYGAEKVISMMCRCIRLCPSSSIKSLINLTGRVFSLSTDQRITFENPYWSSGGIQYEIYDQGNGDVRELLNRFWSEIKSYLENIFTSLGLLHYILIASVLTVLNLKSSSDWKRILFVLPVFIYNFGTSLLLTGYDDTARFFYYTFVLMPVLLIFVFKNKHAGEDIL